MENEFEYLFDRGDHGGHLADKKFEKILFLSRVIAVTVSRFAMVAIATPVNKIKKMPTPNFF